MNKDNIGSSFDDFLKEEAMLEEATAVALKRVIAWQIGEEMKAQHLTKTELAKRMRTSRAALNRLLDEADTSLTLTTLASAASALGKKKSAFNWLPQYEIRPLPLFPALCTSATRKLVSNSPAGLMPLDLA